MEISGLSSRALTAASKLAPFLGAYMGWGSAPRAEGGPGISDQLKFVVDRVKTFKLADPLKTTEMALAKPDSYPIASGIGLGITGYIIREIGKAVKVGTVSRMGSIALKGGASTATNALVASYIYEACNNPHPQGTAGYGPGDRHTIDIDNPQVLETGGGYFAPPLRQTLGVNL